MLSPRRCAEGFKRISISIGSYSPPTGGDSHALPLNRLPVSHPDRRPASGHDPAINRRELRDGGAEDSRRPPAASTDRHDSRRTRRHWLCLLAALALALTVPAARAGAIGAR